MKHVLVLVILGLSAVSFAAEKPQPPAPPDLRVLGPFAEIPLPPTDSKPVAGWRGVGEKLLPVRFTEGDNLRRVAYDFPVRTALYTGEVFSLDVAISSPKLTRISFYLRSGAGWYATTLNLPSAAVGQWTRLVLSRASFGLVEEQPTGWGRLDGVRIAVYRPHDTGTFSGAVAFANFCKHSALSAVSPEMRRYEMEKAAFGPAADAWAKTLPGHANERRLMWCHSPLGLKRDGDWEGSVKTLKSFGYTDLIANLAWGGCSDYKSKVARATRLVETRGDMLDAALAACRKNGVKLHVWNVCWPMSRNIDGSFARSLEAEGRLQIDAKGHRVRTNNTDWLCPSSPENRELVAAMMVELAERGVDGVHFDYIRYPGNDGCYCPKCRERFEATLGATCAAWPTDVLPAGCRRAAWTAFRTGNITALVKRAADEVHRRFPKVEVSAAVFRDPRRDGETVGQDWASWMKAGYMDFVCPMDYTWDLADFVRLITAQKAVVGVKGVYPGIGLTSSARFPQDGGDAYRFSEQVLEVRKAGFPGFTCFNYDPRCARAMAIAREGVLKE